MARGVEVWVVVGAKGEVGEVVGDAGTVRVGGGMVRFGDGGMGRPWPTQRGGLVFIAPNVMGEDEVEMGRRMGREVVESEVDMDDSQVRRHVLLSCLVNHSPRRQCMRAYHRPSKVELVEPRHVDPHSMHIVQTTERPIHAPNDAPNTSPYPANCHSRPNTMGLCATRPTRHALRLFRRARGAGCAGVGRRQGVGGVACVPVRGGTAGADEAGDGGAVSPVVVVVGWWAGAGDGGYWVALVGGVIGGRGGVARRCLWCVASRRLRRRLRSSLSLL